MATKTKVQRPEKKEKAAYSGDITLNPDGPFIAGNMYTASIPAPDDTEGLVAHVEGAGYRYNLIPSFSDGMARISFLAQTVGDAVVFFTQNGKTIATRTIEM